MNKNPREGGDFFPLTVNYQEKTYAAGKIPGGYFKREARPSERETLILEAIARAVRQPTADLRFRDGRESLPETVNLRLIHALDLE